MTPMLKPPYLIAALTRERLTPEEMCLISEIDSFIRTIRSSELISPAEEKKTFIAEHIQNAYSYYSHFNKADMAALELIEAMAHAAAEKEEQK